MKNALAVKEQKPYQLVPTNLNEAMEFAKAIAKSDLAPKDFKDKPDNVFIAMQMGAEVGLSPMQAIQNIAVINGRPSLWGDSMLALCQVHPDFEGIQEYFDEKGTAVCIVKRKGYEPHTQTFSLQDVTLGKMDQKPGPWQTSRKRMMQMRARAFALRDRFADALRGLAMAEEAMDLEPINVTVLDPKQKTQEQGKRLLQQITKEKPAEEAKSSSDLPTPSVPGNTNVQGEAGEVVKPPLDCPQISKEGHPGGESEKQETPEGIYNDIFQHFKGNKKQTHDFLKFFLGEKRFTKMSDIKTLTQDEMTVLRTELNKLPEIPD